MESSNLHTTSPPIHYAPCFVCGEHTDETQSVHGVAHRECFYAYKPTQEHVEAFYTKYPDMDFRK